jgi:hypothetical protein
MVLREIALTKIMEAKMKMMSEARPSRLMMAAMNAIAMK